MNNPPNIKESTKEKRQSYIKERYPCISNCEMCGLCKVFGGKDAQLAYKDYIEGNRSFEEVSADYMRK